MAGAASQAGDDDSSRAPGLTSGLQGSINFHCGATVTVHEFFCILHFDYTACAVSWKVGIPYNGLTTTIGWLSLVQFTVLSGSIIVVNRSFGSGFFFRFALLNFLLLLGILS